VTRFHDIEDVQRDTRTFLSARGITLDDQDLEELEAKAELQTTEGDLDGWQDILRTAIRLAGYCHAACLKARPPVRRRFNDAVLEAVYIKDRRIGRAEFSEVFAPLISRPSSNKWLKVEVRGFEPLTPAVRRQCSTGLSYTPGTAPG
jgi:hypothetical protein